MGARTTFPKTSSVNVYRGRAGDRGGDCGNDKEPKKVE